MAGALIPHHQIQDGGNTEWWLL